MSLDQSSAGENRMQQELSEVLDSINRNLEGGNIGPLETINYFQTEAFMKLVEGIVMDKLQCVLQPALENVIRSVTKGMIDTAFERILNGNPANEIHFSEQRRMRLKFKYKLHLPIWTGIPVKGENGTSIEVSLVDSLTGEIINSGPESSAKIEIVVIKGENDYDAELNSERFSRNIVKERGENKSLLGGDIYVNLKEGIGFAGEFYFAHSSNWMKNCKFRLGARFVNNNNYSNKVREAITESFIIRDRRTKLYEKHDIPSLSDEVWRLKHISRRGGLCKRLRESNIKTVQEFLTEHFVNPQKLQEICGAAVCEKNLEEIVANALKCELNDMHMYYSSCHPQKIGAIFNVVGQLLGTMDGTLYVPIDKLSEELKIEAHESVVSAFKHWGEVILLDKNYPSFNANISNDCYAPASHRLVNFSQQNDGADIMTEIMKMQYLATLIRVLLHLIHLTGVGIPLMTMVLIFSQHMLLRIFFDRTTCLLY